MKLRIILLSFCLMLFASIGFAAGNVSFGALTGGTDEALDAISVIDVNGDGVSDTNGDGEPDDILETGYKAFGTADGQFYSYTYDANSTASENPPAVIVPDDREDGTGAWHRAYPNDPDESTISFSYGADYSGFLEVGKSAVFEFPWDCTITGVRLVSSLQGSIVVDLWVTDEANFPPTSEDSITGDSAPQLSNSYIYTDTTLSGWTTEINEGDFCIFNINSVSDIKMFTITLDVVRARE